MNYLLRECTSFTRYFKQATRLAVTVVLFALAGVATNLAQTQSQKDLPSQENLFTSATNSSEVARQLGNRDAQVRRSAAEELARRAASDEGKMVAGYRAQEKDARVRLALDWALYRMGKTETLFAIVRNLEGSRRNQATSYLKQLEGPEPLYLFLDRAQDEIKIYLIEVLASLGNATTLQRLEPYTSSYDPRIANAAQFALREITRRETHLSDQATRPRQTGKTAKTEDEAPTEQMEGEAPAETP